MVIRNFHKKIKSVHEILGGRVEMNIRPQCSEMWCHTIWKTGTKCLEESARQKGEGARFLHVIGSYSMVGATLLCITYCRPWNSNCGCHWCPRWAIYLKPWKSLVSAAAYLPHTMVVTSICSWTFTTYSCLIFSSFIFFMIDWYFYGTKWTSRSENPNLKHYAYRKQELDFQWLNPQLQILFL